MHSTKVKDTLTDFRAVHASMERINMKQAKLLRQYHPKYTVPISIPHTSQINLNRCLYTTIHGIRMNTC